MELPFWISAFLDLPAGTHEPAVRFWESTTGCHRSVPRGDHREFLSLLPPDGDDFVRVQRLDDGGPRVHLDLHVIDPRRSADRAIGLGATEVADRGHVVLTSPGGLPFCFVSHPASTRPAPTIWDDGSTSLLDQVCLDIPSSQYDEECGFWSALTTWEHQPSPISEEFGFLERPPEVPIRLLTQRLGEASGSVRTHLDFAAEDRPAEVRRHAILGAQLIAEHREWTVLRDPAGSDYCITDRDPKSGVIG
ncbi:MAG: VOC family protein [Nocardioides sp.]|nr:VOC family protein [Nocardioides sp.]